MEREKATASAESKVVKFRVPENWVSPKLRPKLPIPGSPTTKQPGHLAATITQADLQEHLELKAAFILAKRAFLKNKKELVAVLQSGAAIEPGFLIAEITMQDRKGRAYEKLLVGC